MINTDFFNFKDADLCSFVGRHTAHSSFLWKCRERPKAVPSRFVIMVQPFLGGCVLRHDGLIRK